jgi:Protein of unknown function (DUF2510)
MVAGIFKVAAWLIIIAGIGTAIAVDRATNYIGNKGDAVGGVIAGTIFAAAAVGFFAYVLDLLIGIERNTSSGQSPVGVASPQPTPWPAPAASPAVPAFGRAGWYEDPQGLARVRFWDGHGWTDQTQA